MSNRLRARYAPYIFLAPFLLTFAAFILYPLIRSVWLSFYITAGPDVHHYVGLENFRMLLGDTSFHRAVWNTVVFAFFSVFLQLPLSLGLALLLNSRFVYGRNLFRLAFFSPHLVGMVFVAVLFSVIYAPNYGLLNVGLFHVAQGINELVDMLNSALGLTLGLELNWAVDTNWLGRSEWVMPALVLTALWLFVGFNMVYFLAALQAVDRDLYDAARVDGAGPIRRFIHVTLPGIRHVAVFVVVLSTIGSFQLFELPYIMLEGSGPDEAGLTVVMYLYQNGFITGDLGYASAIGWVLVFGVMAIAICQLWASGTLKKEQ